MEQHRWSRVGVFGLLTLAALSVLLWAFGNRIPYGYDASGAYLTYRAAYNAVTFPNDNPLVADVSLSPDPAAHPTYDLRNPNALAQLLSQLILRAGVWDVGGHTALAILVSVSGFFFAIKVLTRLGGAAVAAVAMLLFALQYIGVLTWTTNPQTALYFPLFWGNLYLLLRYAEQPTRARLGAVGAGIAMVFLSSLALGAFVLLTEVCLFWQLSKPAEGKLRLTLAAIAGAAAGVALLLAVAGPGVVSALLPTDVAGQWLQVPSAYRATFGLGQGALALVVYALVIVELAAAACGAVPRIRRRWPGELAALLGIGLAIVFALWLDRSTSLVDDWEPIAGRPLVHVGLWLALAGVLGALGMQVMQLRRPESRSLELRRIPGVPTASSFVVSVGLAALILTVFPIGDFTQNFVRGYEPALVFVEDVLLATFALALLGKIRAAGRWSPGSTAIAAGLVALGAYWLAYQGSLAVRFPPREIGVASALRGNAALAGASFIATDLSPVVWYYTRGRALSADSGPLPEPTFLVCARGPAEPPAPLACDGWTTQLHGLGYPIDPGQNPIEAPDYLIYALPPCASLHVPASAAGSACGPMAAAPPTLAPLSAAPDASRVDLKVTLEAAGSLAHVDYTYAQAAGTPEAGSVVRLYVLQTDGNWCLLDETAGSHDIRFPAASAGDFRASVIPRSSLAAGQQYFTAAVDLPPAYIFDLPDTRNGGVQHISAYSLEAAEQQAIAAGTWNPSAGTLGQDARTTLVDKPTADNVCRGQIR